MVHSLQHLKFPTFPGSEALPGHKLIMALFIKFPLEIIRDEIFSFLNVKELVNLDSAVVGASLRAYVQNAMFSTILVGNQTIPLSRAALNWLQKRQIHLVRISVASVTLRKKDCTNFPALFDCCENITFSNFVTVTEYCLTTMVQHCSRIQTLNLSGIYNLDDSMVVMLSVHCSTLTSLDLSHRSNLTDRSIVAITKNCKNIKILVGGFGSDHEYINACYFAALQRFG